MKTLMNWTLPLLLILPSACAFRDRQLAIQPVGPDPAKGYAASNQGSLVVYSAWSRFNNNYTIDHGGYDILAGDGRLVRWVPNHIAGDFTAEPPTKVNLAPGAYRVRAVSEDYGRLTVPVVVKAGQTTVVYLDCDNHPFSANAGGDLVKLPDGQIIGWAANTEK